MIATLVLAALGLALLYVLTTPPEDSDDHDQ